MLPAGSRVYKTNRLVISGGAEQKFPAIYEFMTRIPKVDLELLKVAVLDEPGMYRIWTRRYILEIREGTYGFEIKETSRYIEFDNELPGDHAGIEKEK
jgi:hypothetical protein